MSKIKRLTLQLSGSHSVSVGLSLLLLRVQFNHVVDSEDSDSSLSGEFQGFYFRNSGFKYSGFFVVFHSSLNQIKTHPVKNLIVKLNTNFFFFFFINQKYQIYLLPFKISVVNSCLAGVVVSSQFSNKIRRILSSINGKCFWDHQ